MKTRHFFPILLALFVSAECIGGAWGTGPFDNDDASDWIWELEESSGPSVIEAALRPVAASSGYIEAPSASYSIAAAEALAAMLGKPAPSTPPEVVTWAGAQSFQPSMELLQMARTALNNVRDENRSELAQLWSDAGSDYDEWKRTLSSLSDRLK